MVTDGLGNAAIDLRGPENDAASLAHLAECANERDRDILGLKRIKNHLQFVQKENEALGAVVHV